MRAFIYCVALMGAFLYSYYTWPEGLLRTAFALLAVVLFFEIVLQLFDKTYIGGWLSFGDMPKIPFVHRFTWSRNYELWAETQLFKRLERPWLSSADRNAIEDELRRRGRLWGTHKRTRWPTLPRPVILFEREAPQAGRDANRC